MSILEVAKEMFINQGIEQGEEKRNALFVENLVLSTDFTDERIAQLVDVSIAFVQQTRIGLKK